MKRTAIVVLMLGVVGVTWLALMVLVATSVSMAVVEGLASLSPLTRVVAGWLYFMLPFLVLGIPYVRRKPLADRRSFQLATIVSAVLPWLVIIPPIVLGRGLVSVPFWCWMSLPIFQLVVAALVDRSLHAV